LYFISGHKDVVRSIDVYSNRLYSGSFDSTVREWDMNGGLLRTYSVSASDKINCLVVDGEYLYAGVTSFNKRLVQWRISDGLLVKSFDGFTSFFDSNGRTYSVCFCYITYC
jgi:WD40 repeat protein